MLRSFISINETKHGMEVYEPDGGLFLPYVELTSVDPCARPKVMSEIVSIKDRYCDNKMYAGSTLSSHILRLDQFADSLQEFKDFMAKEELECICYPYYWDKTDKIKEEQMISAIEKAYDQALRYAFPDIKVPFFVIINGREYRDYQFFSGNQKGADEDRNAAGQYSYF